MKFLVLYSAPISAKEQMASATPEQAKAGMDAWTQWAKKAGDAIVDLGMPLGDGKSVSADLVRDSSTKIVGYSILQGDSLEVVTALLKEHPHGRIPNFSIEVLECLAMPGTETLPSQAA